MQIDAELIVYGLIFVGVLVLVEGIYLTVFGKSISLNSRVSRRLQLMEKGDSREKVLEQLRKEMNQHLKAQEIPLYSLLAKKAQLAGLAFTPIQLVIIMFGLSAVTFVGLSVGTTGSPPVRILISIVLGFGAVFVWVSNKAKKRMKLIEEQLPDAVELMVRSLRVGHPFSATLKIVSEEIPDPLATEMGVISDEAAYGRNIGESLKHMAERLDNQDLRFLAVAVTIQQVSGGNLAEILEGLSKVIRSRFRLFRRVNAITAEARWSGNFLSAFPVVAIMGITVLKPGYYDGVKDTEFFVIASLGVAAMLVVNLFVMRALTNIKV